MIQKLIYRIKILRKVSLYADGVKKFFLIKLICCFVLLITSLVLPIFYSKFIEDVILGARLSGFVYIVTGYIVIQLVNSLISFINNFCTYSMNNTVTVAIRLKILDNKLKQDFSEYDNINPGNEKMILDDAVFKLCDFSGVQSTDYFISFGKMIFLGAALFVMEWRLALVLIVTIPISFVLNHINGTKAKKNNRETWENDKAWGNWIFTSMWAWREIRVLNQENRFLRRFLEYSEKYSKLFRTYTQFWVTRRFTIPKIKDEFLMQFVVYFLGGVLIYYGHITIGTLLVFSQYYAMLTEAVQTVVSTDTDLQINSVQYDKALAACEEEIIIDKTKIKEIPNCNLEFQQVTFRYPESNTDILKAFSMQIQQGERVGIVGESGKGKTTLLNLIVGLLQPTAGKILFGEKELSELDLRSVHKKVGFVLQENALFNTTIRENLLYGNENATVAEMREACEKACIRSYIEDLPEKYDTIVGEKGIKLSGGQKQRLILARLFLRDVDMFIFDEATSALDQHSENLIQNAIRSIGDDKTIIVVAHRESSLELCDRLIYL